MAKKKKKKPKYNVNSNIRSAIRRVFSRSPFVRAKIQEVRRERPRYKKDGTLAKRPHVEYQCAECQRWFKSTEIAVDHIDPVISLEDGFVDWNTFVDRLFCEPDNLQVVCSYLLKNKDKHGGIPSCHHRKTQEERKLRKEKEKGKIAKTKLEE